MRFDETQLDDYKTLLQVDNEFYNLTNWTLEDVLVAMRRGNEIVFSPNDYGEYDIIVYD